MLNKSRQYEITRVRLISYFQNSSTAATVWLWGAMERLPFSNVSGIQQLSVFQYPSKNKKLMVVENTISFIRIIQDSMRAPAQSLTYHMCSKVRQE